MSAVLSQTLSPAMGSRSAESATRRVIGWAFGWAKPRDASLLSLENMLDDPRLLGDIGLTREEALRELEAARRRSAVAPF